ncbi:MAG: hypothetical protein O7F73_16630 [Gammaproteobacteria bacterium]|nr:hypothetical protein [Gammaproteobacteria bacterium]
MPGNIINGLGVAEKVRATQIFHGSGARQLEWRKLELFFALINPLRVYWLNLVNRWMLRRADGPVAGTQQPAADPAVATQRIKQLATEFGAC